MEDDVSLAEVAVPRQVEVSCLQPSPKHSYIYIYITGSLAESPECWNLEFQPVKIFADNFLIFSIIFIYLQAFFL